MIQIGKYKRPGIFIEEIDKSVFTTPSVENTLSNLIIGVSKKGPVNTPIRLTTVGDLEAVFGQLDRNLERKGSFFHRTISKMLETTPVYAMNLLLTDDTLDVIEYKSISTSAGKFNDIKREGPYRRFFDTTGFWKKDTESFINLTKDNTGYEDRAISFTNMSDKYISVFAVKTAVTGFDRTLLEWYGSVEKMPPYVSTTDYASDYMIDLVVIAGDWSNYKELAVDSRWSKYFNADGLVKSQLRSFANDRNVTLLAYYEGISLIPYFRDLEGKNIFVETTVNRDTDTTGLYCAFNADLIEKDYYTGLLDLIGGTLVGTEQSKIEFLSYKENIIETVPFTSLPLDLPGNVIALFGATSNSGNGYVNQYGHAYGTPKESGIVINGSNRTAWFTEGAVMGINSVAGTGTISGSGTSSTITVDYFAGLNTSGPVDNPYTIIGGKYIPVPVGTTTTTLRSSSYEFSGVTASYTTTFTLNVNGVISGVTSYSANTTPSVAGTDVVLGYLTYQVVNGGFVGTPVLNPVTVTDSETYVDPGYVDGVYLTTSNYLDFSYGATAAYYDYFVYDMSGQVGYEQGDIKLVFWGTSDVVSTTNYKQYRKIKMFNALVSAINSTNKDKMALIISKDSAGGTVKKSLEDMTITEIVTSTTQNKSFVLKTGLSDVSYIAGENGGALTFYKVDNEFILGGNGFSSQTGDSATTDMGAAGKYSDVYEKYYNGLINDGDFFYDNRLYTDASGTKPVNGILMNGTASTVNVTFVNGEASPNPVTPTTGLTSSYAGYNYVVFETPEIGATAAYSALDLGVLEQIKFPKSLNNQSTFTITTNNVVTSDTPVQLASKLGFVGNYFAYPVAEDVTFEVLTKVTMMYNMLNQHYLQLFIDLDGNLSGKFVDKENTALELVDVEANYILDVQSELSNLKETLEIEVPTGYTEVPNKVLINAARYPEVKVGDFLLANISELNLEPGQTVVNNLTRILTKRQYAGDTSLAEITCDAAIAKTGYGEDYQTTRYSTIDQYATTYKAIALKGFRIRQASLPDGTESKQNQILNLVAKGTQLFKSITNKEAFNFRYLVDAFGLGLTERSKQQLVDICGERLDVFGFINMPSIKSFKNSTSPTFVDSEGVLQVEFIAKGGDPESNPAFLYSFGDGDGVTTVGYFTPYVTVNDNGRPLDMPPAAHAATTYVRKHITNVSSVTPWTIAAGVTNGKITNISGIEYDFTPSDIEFLYPAQMNPIVYKRNRGYVIETENTALVLYKSALSLIHVREVLIELERELASMLLDYQWKFNTPDVRAEIKLRADVICETYVNKNGLYNYFNKMDDENNTSDVIDSQIGVIDTYVEPIKGMGIIVNNVTILRTGAIAAGGFINA